MMNYFKPPRRKFGVATLVLACFCMVAWTRSWILNDTIAIPFKTYASDRYPHLDSISYVVNSTQGQIGLIERRVYAYESATRLLGINDEVMIRISYLFVVPMLIVLSVWLLFSKPRAPSDYRLSGHSTF